jgi:hypothetical protein
MRPAILMGQMGQVISYVLELDPGSLCPLW